MNSIQEVIDYKEYPILYIDDLKKNLESFKETFEKDFTIFLVESGPQALELLKEENITVVLADQRMPEMTGTEFFKIIKDKYPQIIRILITAYSDIEAVEKAVNEGKIFGYIRKPLENEVIRERIKQGIQFYHIIKEKMGKKALEHLMTMTKELYQSLTQPSRNLLDINELGKLAEYAMDMISDNIDPVYGAIYLYDRDSGRYYLRACRGELGDGEQETIEKETSFVRYLYKRKQPVRYGDLKRWAEQSLSPDLQKVEQRAKKLRAELIVPMVIDRLLGFIVLGKKRSGGGCTANDWNTLILVANNIAMAVHSINNFEDAITDPTTGIYNPRYFQYNLDQAVATAVRYKRPLSLLVIDIDKFKEYNDTYGHDQGDDILKAFGKHLREVCRTPDIPCRSGGDEFVVILPETEIDGARVIADRLCTGMKNKVVLSVVSVSAGVSCVIPNKDDSPRTVYDFKKTSKNLYTYADKQVYCVKQNGGNAISVGKPFRPTVKEGEAKSLKILVVEDEPGVAQSMRHMFSLKGFEVKITNNARQCMDAFGVFKPGLVLMDLNLPDMDGAELMEKMMAQNSRVRFDIISGYGERKPELLDRGAKKFHLKPLDLPGMAEEYQKYAEENVDPWD